MSTNKKRLATIAAGVVTAGVVAGGIGFAAYTQEKESNAVQSSAARFAALSVAAAADRPSLYPNQKSGVNFSLANTNDVQVRITKIEPVPLTDGDIKDVDNGNRTYCREHLVLTGSSMTNKLLPAGSTQSPARLPVYVQDAIRLAADTDNRCQGMTFATKWTVTSETAEGGTATTTSTAS